ncbi:hypothetical protein JW826_01605 [Candidatus Woesearchaeota archaeon]|nr:hypothetical protein [Candidatus Woesearchaeota archaeon]
MAEQYFKGIGNVKPPYSAIVVEKNEIKPGILGRLRGQKPRLEVVVEEHRQGEDEPTIEMHTVPPSVYMRVQLKQEVIDNPAFYKLNHKK